MTKRIRKLYFGDNLEIMREHVADESVDLVYLDPPFNSNQAYNVLFKGGKLTPVGRRILVDRIVVEGWPVAVADPEELRRLALRDDATGTVLMTAMT